MASNDLVFALAVSFAVIAVLLLSLGIIKDNSTTAISTSSTFRTPPPILADDGFSLPVSTGSHSFQVDVVSLRSQIDRLAELSDTKPPAVTRILFTESDMAARRYVRSLMTSAGLEVHEDPVGNIYGRWNGSHPDLPYVLTGSHTDAIPHSGKYDGVVGVLGAIEAIAALRRSGFVPRRSIQVIMFTSEEPTRFGYGCLGSRLIANQEGFASKLREVADKDGVSFEAAAAFARHPDSLHPDSLKQVAIPWGKISSFVELHIEQGPMLEAQGVQIGVVTAIAAPAALSIELRGIGGHAGGVLMEDRNDVGLAAAEVALSVEQHVLATGSRDTVGTTGKVDLRPGLVNSIPREAYIEIDIRDINGGRRDSVVAAVKKSVHDIAKRRNVSLTEFRVVNSDPPAKSASSVMAAVEDSVKELGLSHMRMVSRAYHDSLFMARVAPMSMIFIPCRNGYSHRPDEFASKQDLANGATVLAHTLAKLSMK